MEASTLLARLNSARRFHNLGYYSVGMLPGASQS